MKRSIRYELSPGPQFKNAYKILKWLGDFSAERKLGVLSERMIGTELAATACLNSTIELLDCLTNGLILDKHQTKLLRQLKNRLYTLRNAVAQACASNIPLRKAYVARCLTAMTLFKRSSRRLSPGCATSYGQVGLAAISLWNI